MVASRACHDCRRRKVKCDYRVPTCFRCEKAKIACHGYQRDAIFVNRTPENLSITALSVLKQNNLDLHVSRDFDQTLHLLNSQVQNPIGPRTQFRLQALELLKKLYLPQPSQADIRETSIFSWLQIICELEGKSHALDYSLLTFCVIQVAITKSGSVGIDEALQVYNDALQILQVEIQDISAGQSDEILAAISVLSSGELFVCPLDDSWRAHAHGISEILRIRNERMDSPSPLWPSFCARIRIVLLLESLVNRNARSMAISHCRQLMSTSAAHDSFHELMDVACEVPVLFEKSELLIATHNISGVLPEQWRTSLFKDSLIVLEKLHDRHEKYRNAIMKRLYWAMPSTVYNPADDLYNSKLFPFSLHFETLEIASQVVLSWTILLQLLCSMIDIYEHFFGISILSPAFDHHSLELEEQGLLLNTRFPTISSVKQEADKLSRYLCQSIEYCHKIENGTSGPQMTTYAQWILKSYFRRFQYERELVWTLNIKNMSGVGFRKGIELMGFEDRASQFPFG